MRLQRSLVKKSLAVVIALPALMNSFSTLALEAYSADWESLAKQDVPEWVKTQIWRLYSLGSLLSSRPWRPRLRPQPLQLQA